METVSPVTVDVDPGRVSEPRALLSLLATLQRVLPRGKAAVPRRIGRKLGRPLSGFMRTRHGAKLVLSPSSYDVYATMRIHGDAWDYHDLEICRAGLPDGGVFYEIGANVGYFAVEHAFLDRTGKVFAFEPQADLAQAIAASARLNGLGHLTVFNVLVGDHSGPATLYLAPGSIHASAIPDSGRPVSGTVAAVMISIDDLRDRGAVASPDMVKIDVEGSEALVFRGAAKTFRSARPNLYLEYLPEYDAQKEVRREVERLLQDVPSYRLFGSPSKELAAKYPGKLFPITRDEQWREVDGLFLQNRDRPARDSQLFAD